MRCTQKMQEVFIYRVILRIALWILQVLLAAQFLWHGWLMVAPVSAVLTAALSGREAMGTGPLRAVREDW